jgi:xanthine/CO dehydrogenase XdhC/CoxF family maturation factor
MSPQFNADIILTAGVENPLGGIDIEADAAVVVMTHSYQRDEIVLPLLLSRPLKYLGVLGPRRRTETLPGGAVERVYAPIGFDIGAETPETIALSIVAEIQAVLAARPGPSLRDRDGPIYLRHHAPYNTPACPESA